MTQNLILIAAYDQGIIEDDVMHKQARGIEKGIELRIGVNPGYVQVTGWVAHREGVIQVRLAGGGII
jgi:hypothetical protein